MDDLWTLAAAWPTDKLPAPVPELIYRHLPANDGTRSKIYTGCSEPIFRKAILDTCTSTDIATLKLGVQDANEDCRDHAKWRIATFDLYDQVDQNPEEETKSLTDRITKLKHWWQRTGEELFSIIMFLGFILLALYAIVFTESGARYFDKVYSTPLGAIVIWVGGGIAALSSFSVATELITKYRWLSHCFWLCMIAVSYFLSKDQWVTTILIVWYSASLVLPRIWEELSNELVDRIAIRVKTKE